MNTIKLFQLKEGILTWPVGLSLEEIVYIYDEI